MGIKNYQTESATLQILVPQFHKVKYLFLVNMIYINVLFR